MIHKITINISSSDNINHTSESSQSVHFIKRGTPQFKRITLALFSAGLATCTMLYCVQPILPVLSREFAISPTSSSISLSISTGTLAIGLLFSGPLSDIIGRKPVMVTTLLLASVCTLLLTMMTSWYAILMIRMLIGLFLSGVVVVSMTYLTEEIHPNVLPFSMGLYISGNSIGGMSGRLLSAIFTDLFSWRVAMTVIGCFSLTFALICWKFLPKSRHFFPVSLQPKILLTNFYLHCRNKSLPRLFLIGFLLMGAFVTFFNYLGYRLILFPWCLDQTAISLLSVSYLIGVWSSPKAGTMTIRYGYGSVMISSIAVMFFGLLITLSTSLWFIFIGMLLFSGGFFPAHSVASSMIGPRAHHAKGQASSLYLFSYYLGSSIAGTLGGLFWYRFGWNGVIVFISIILCMALLVGSTLLKPFH